MDHLQRGVIPEETDGPVMEVVGDEMEAEETNIQPSMEIGALHRISADSAF